MTMIPKDAAIFLPLAPLTDIQRDCVEKLKEALEQAELGNVSAIGLVLCMKGGYASVIGGTNAAELNLGCDSLKRKILDEIEGTPKIKPTAIIKGLRS